MSFSFASAIALAVLCIGIDLAAAQGTCASHPLPDFMSGSPPGQRSPIAIRADPTDAQRCNLVANNCVAPATATVTESAPSCTCVCR
jgi:hypothetical protein